MLNDSFIAILLSDHIVSHLISSCVDCLCSALVNMSREPVYASSSVGAAAQGITLPNATPAAAAAREQAELNLAIQLSLQDNDTRRAAGAGGAASAGSLSLSSGAAAGLYSGTVLSLLSAPSHLIAPDPHSTHPTVSSVPLELIYPPDITHEASE